MKKFLLQIRKCISSANDRSLGLILLMVLVFFVSKWVLQGAYFKNDLVIITIPLENLYAQIQRSGQSPLWAPELAGGYPLLAIGQLGFWYPLHMLLRQFLPAVWTLNLSLLLHTMLAAGGTYLFLKHNKINKVAAGSAALLLSLGSTFVGKYEMINLVLPFMWVPLIFLFLQLFMERGKPAYFFAWIGANALCVLIGHPQMTVYILFSEAIFVFCLMGLQWRLWLRSFVVLLGVFLILGLTSFYLFPIVDNIQYTDRANGSVNEDSNGIFDYQFSPRAFKGLILSHPFGHGDTYSGPTNESELSCYFGPLALGLAVLGLFAGKRKFPVVWWLSFLLVVIGLSLAIGGYSPIFRWMVHHGWKYFNCPARFFFYTHIGISLLAAMGLDFCIFRPNYAHSNIKKYIIGFLLVGTLAPALWVSWSWDKGVPWKFTGEPAVAKILQKEKGSVRVISRDRISDTSPDNNFGIKVGNLVCSKCIYKQSFISPFKVINGLAVKLSRPGSETGLIKLSLYTNNGEKIRESSLTAQNIIDSDWNNFIFQPVENIDNKELYFELTSNMEGDQAPRLFIHTNPLDQYDPSGMLFNCANKICKEVSVNQKLIDADFKVITNPTQAVEWHEAMAPYVSAGYGVGSILWAGSLPILDVRNYIKPLGGWGDSIGQDNYRTMINRFSTTHLIGLYPPYRYATNSDEVTLLSTVPFGDQFIRLYRNNKSFPRLQFAQFVKNISGGVNQINTLLQFDTKEQKTVVADVNKDFVFDVSKNKAQIIKDERTRIEIQTEQESEGFLVLRDVLLDGWTAKIDNQLVSVNRVDGIFRGIFVPAGKHSVIFQYSPKWIKAAIYTEIISVTILALLIFFSRKRF